MLGCLNLGGLTATAGVVCGICCAGGGDGGAVAAFVALVALVASIVRIDIAVWLFFYSEGPEVRRAIHADMVY